MTDSIRMDSRDLRRIRKNNDDEIKKARRIKEEPFYGMVEYKLQINDILGTDKQEQIKTQMLFRLHQGEGKAVYNIGYRDDGHPTGVDYELLLNSLKVVKELSQQLEADIKSIKIRKGKSGYCAIIFMINDELCHDLLPIEADSF